MKTKLLQLLSVVFLLLISYYSFEVLEARRSTQSIVQNEMSRIEDKVTLSELSDARLQLLLKVQDENFFTHGGTDFSSGRVTTITQSLVKFLYFDDFKPGLAKIRQSLIARFALNPLVSKEEQLFLFLNRSYFGQNGDRPIRGFGKASRYYFNKPFTELEDEDYLALLAMLFGPNQYNIKTSPEKNRAKVEELKKQHKI